MSHFLQPERFSRRRVLAALGGGAAFLPVLRSDSARAAAFPKRLIVIAWPNGVSKNEYWPGGDENNFAISDSPTAVLKSLKPHAKDVLLLGGLTLQNMIDDVNFADGGHAAFPYMFTGVKGEPVSVAVDQNGFRRSAGGKSVDQVIADAIGEKTKLPFHSLQFQITNIMSGGGEQFLSFRGPPIAGRPNGPRTEYDPAKIFARLFGGNLGPGISDTEIKKVRSDRASILDFVRRDLDRATKVLGKEDRQRIALHLESVRTLEKDLAAAATTSVMGCRKPTAPPSKDFNSEVANVNFPEAIKLQTDMTVAAMACDSTRVSSHLWCSCHNNNVVFHWLGKEFVEGRDPDNAGFGGPYRHHHEIGHNEFRNTDTTRRKQLVDQWFVSQMAYFIEALKARPEGAGTMLDNSLIVFANSMSNGASHSVRDLPWILAGRAGGAFKTGRSLRWASGETNRQMPQNPLLAEICNAFDVPKASFGDPKYGGLSSRIRGL